MESPTPVILSKTHSIFLNYLAELRDETIQADRLRFRHNMERVGELLAYEISKQLHYTPRTVQTPLGTLDTPVLEDQPVLVTILRAALPLQAGFLRIFDRADNAFISAFRKYTNSNKYIIHVEYVSAPDLTDRTVILLDPMIATGKSMVLSYEQLLSYGVPSRLYIAGVIASEEGLDYLQRHIPQAHIYIGDVDSELTAKGYIVPGLGDAGDLAFGKKNG
jgi:uracil phosphoribosyltransferase